MYKMRMEQVESKHQPRPRVDGARVLDRALDAARHLTSDDDHRDFRDPVIIQNMDERHDLQVSMDGSNPRMSVGYTM